MKKIFLTLTLIATTVAITPAAMAAGNKAEAEARWASAIASCLWREAKVDINADDAPVFLLRNNRGQLRVLASPSATQEQKGKTKACIKQANRAAGLPAGSKRVKVKFKK